MATMFGFPTCVYCNGNLVQDPVSQGWDCRACQIGHGFGPQPTLQKTKHTCPVQGCSAIIYSQLSKAGRRYYGCPDCRKREPNMKRWFGWEDQGAPKANTPKPRTDNGAFTKTSSPYPMRTDTDTQQIHDNKVGINEIKQLLETQKVWFEKIMQHLNISCENTQ